MARSTALAKDGDLMAYENDGYMGYVLTSDATGAFGLAGDKIYGDRLQTRELAARLQRESEEAGHPVHYGVGGIVSVENVGSW